MAPATSAVAAALPPAALAIAATFRFPSFWKLAPPGALVAAAAIAAELVGELGAEQARQHVHRAAGGECEVEIFKGCEHQWINDPGPQTDRAHEMLKAFIARQLGALRKAA